MTMGLLKKSKTEDKLPLFARRGVVNGKKQNYLERYVCDRCDGLFRSVSALNSHKCK
jgi:hypothetical protein